MFETAMFNDLMEQFCKAAHDNSKDKGFWDEGFELIEGVEKDIPVNRRPINYGEKYMLMVSELCELFEAHRKGKLTAPCDKPCHIIDPTSTEPIRIRCEACNGRGAIPIDNGSASRSSTTQMCPVCAGQGLITTTGLRPLTNEEEELADICIRIGDYAGYRGIDLGAAILAKMKYNSSRPHMHGKTC